MIRPSTLRPAPLLLSGIVVFPLLLIIQGNDFTDMGFNLSNQWLIWHDAESYQHGYMLYLSNVVGGLWLTITKPLGLFAIKLGWVLVLYLTALLSFLTLKDSGRAIYIEIGLLLALVWSTKLGTTWMSYNELSALAFVATALLLVDGLTGDKRWFSFAAGAVAAASVFLRFPNILLLAILLAVPFYAWVSGKKPSWTIKQALCFLAGFGAAVVVLLALMWGLGHLEAYWGQLSKALVGASSDPSNPYSSGSLLGKLIADYRLLAMSTLLSVAFLLITTWALTSKWYWQLAYLMVGLFVAYLLLPPGLGAVYTYLAGGIVIAIIGATWYLNRDRALEDRCRAILFAVGIIFATLIFLHYFHTYSIWLVPGLLYVAMGYQMWRGETPGERLVAGVALFVVAVVPLGSGNGMINAVFGVWLALPLAVAILLDRVRRLSDLPFYERRPLVPVVVVLSAIGIVGLNTAIGSAYRDSIDRSLMTTPIDIPFFRGTVTTKDRARVVEELMEELPRHVASGDPLLMHGGCALVYLLTDARPVLGTVWDGAYTPEFYETKLRQLDESSQEWPVVLLSKGSCRDRNWPVSLRATRNEAIKRQILSGFMNKRDYGKVWENDYFEIWKPGA